MALLHELKLFFLICKTSLASLWKNAELLVSCLIKGWRAVAISQSILLPALVFSVKVISQQVTSL